MSSSSSVTTNYQYQSASTAATRSLVSDSRPEVLASASINDVDPSPRPGLQRKMTDNYERAAAEAASKAGGGQATATAATTFGDAAAAGTTADRPGVSRQQSWKITDLKGQQQGQMLTGAVGHGYSSTSK